MFFLNTLLYSEILRLQHFGQIVHPYEQGILFFLSHFKWQFYQEKNTIFFYLFFS